VDRSDTKTDEGAGVTRGTILVTGGAGFIGSELAAQLAAKGRRVLVVDNLVNGRRENLAEIGGNVELLERDVRDVAEYESRLRETAVVYHLACLGVRHSLHSPIENHDVNATATLGLLQACRAAEVPRFVYVSSSEVYGTARWAPMSEEHPTFPSTVYGGSKLAGECYARAFHRSYGYATVIVRPFNTYGPRSHHEGDSGEVIPKFLLRCLAGKPMVVFGDGTQTRDFTYVSDTAAGILLAGESEKAVGATINLGSGVELTINDVAKEVAAVAGRAAALVEHDAPRPGDVLRLCSDLSLASSLLGYRPRVPLAEGLRRLRQWYEALGVSPERLLEQEIVCNWASPGAQRRVAPARS
jgi:UDP-glucose 4-epimerase